jgi:hypothetical protein
MSLEYYLYCRKSYDKILQELDYIIDIYEDINDTTYFEENLESEYIELFKTEHNKNFFIERKKNIEHLRSICNSKVLQLCCHQIVDDDIDITPERSQRIRYCDICDFVEEN